MTADELQGKGRENEGEGGGEREVDSWRNGRGRDCSGVPASCSSPVTARREERDCAERGGER